SLTISSSAAASSTAAIRIIPTSERPPNVPGPGSMTQIPSNFNLSQNYPDPFNPSTRISFSLKRTSLVTIKVFDLLGREVATRANRKEMSRGDQSVEFDGTALPSGVYFYHLKAEPASMNALADVFSAVKKMVLLK